MISVITITFNNYDELKETICSIAGLPEVESVVINGGSNEETREWLKSHVGIVVNEKDEGISDAFNKGFKNSTGEFITYLNSGDILVDRTYYEFAEQQLKNNTKIDFVYSNLIFVDQDVGETVMKPRGRDRVNLGEGMPFPHPTMVVRRKVFEKIGGFSNHYKIAMDFDFVVRMIQAGCEGLYYPHATVKMNGAGVSTSKELQGIDECQRSLESHGMFQGAILTAFKSRKRIYQIRGSVKKVFGLRALVFLKKIKARIAR